jgi:membrane fusion protein (multidrug efflux system)
MEATEETVGNPRRRKALLVLASVFGVVALAWLLWWYLVLSRRETTTDAYVAGNQIAVSSQVSDPVIALLVDDTQRVETGQELIRLDATDARLALARTESALRVAVDGARQQNATAGQFDAQTAGRRLELEQAEAQLARRRPLLATKAISLEELRQAETQVELARAALLASERQAIAARAIAGKLTPEAQPVVGEARALYQQAWVSVRRHRILAPASGYVARRSVQIGQRVQPGEPLLTIVPLDKVWIDGNFKESQLKSLRIGQTADITADMYGSSVHYKGRVTGMAAGTGAAFSLLPAQNASGNWVKVVQRIPVRIELDAAELQQHPLRIGLSISVKVDTQDKSGDMLNRSVQQTQVAGTSLYDADVDAAAAAAEAVVRGGEPLPP